MSLQERFYNAVLGYKPFYETTMNLSLEYDIQLRQEHINNIDNRIIATNKNKSKEYIFIPVGTFMNNKFTWNNTSIKQLILEHVNAYNFVQQNYISFNDLNEYFGVFRKLQTPVAPHPGRALLEAAELLESSTPSSLLIPAGPHTSKLSWAPLKNYIFFL